MPTNPPSKQFLRCPCCGNSVAPAAFTRGALGNGLQALRQTFVGRGKGTNGGAVTWERRPMQRAELEAVGLAVARAGERLVDALDGDPIVPVPEASVLASLDDDEAERLAEEWVDEANAELERRLRIVEQDRERRVFGT